MKSKITKEEKPNIINKINFSNCEKHYTGQLEDSRHSHHCENQLAIKHHDVPRLIEMHVDTRSTKKILESWIKVKQRRPEKSSKSGKWVNQQPSKLRNLTNLSINKKNHGQM